VDLRQLEYFVAVARRRHFRRAAEDLFVTQSAVSQQVRRLEAELGLTLLHRTSRGVELTPAGADLLGRAEGLLAEVAATRAAMDAHVGALRGGVRVAATAGDALGLAPALARFAAGQPGVRVALRQASAGDAAALVAQGAVDLAVAALGGAALGGAPPPELRAERLAGEALVLVVPEDDPLAGAAGVRLWDVRERPFILAEPGMALRDAVLEACAAAGFGPVPLFEVGEPTTVRFLVHAGLGVSVVPAAWLQHAGPAVGQASLARPAPRHALWLLSRPAPLTPAAQLLHDHLRAELA
jgi:DNA-binding transcriptional LysR family regulator